MVVRMAVNEPLNDYGIAFCQRTKTLVAMNFEYSFARRENSGMKVAA